MALELFIRPASWELLQRNQQHPCPWSYVPPRMHVAIAARSLDISIPFLKTRWYEIIESRWKLSSFQSWWIIFYNLIKVWKKEAWIVILQYNFTIKTCFNCSNGVPHVLYGNFPVAISTILIPNDQTSDRISYWPGFPIWKAILRTGESISIFMFILTSWINSFWCHICCWLQREGTMFVSEFLFSTNT